MKLHEYLKLEALMKSFRTGVRALAKKLVWMGTSRKYYHLFQSYHCEISLRVAWGYEVHDLGRDASRGGDTAQTLTVDSGLHTEASCPISYCKGPGTASTVDPLVRSEVRPGSSKLWHQGIPCMTRPSIRHKLENLSHKQQ